jgi:hypothetical protein
MLIVKTPVTKRKVIKELYHILLSSKQQRYYRQVMDELNTAETQPLAG